MPTNGALPDLTSAIEMVTLSDPGQVRSNNEDAVFIAPPLGLAILADGMGGYNAGEVASRIAIETVGKKLMDVLAAGSTTTTGTETGWIAEALTAAFSEANDEILSTGRRDPQCSGMGTTLVTSCFYDNRIVVAHAGDSRLYRLRGEVLDTLTRDHSLLQEQIDSGLITPEQARHSQNKNLVTRALGGDSTIETDVADFAVEPGDIYLLCSDGLNDMVEDEEIASALGMLAANLPLAATQLVQMANDNGGRDNVSVILVKIKAPFPAVATPTGWWQRLFSWFQ